MGRLTPLGIGHSNIFLERDYRGDKGWCVRVETEIPIKNEPEVKAWLESTKPGDIEALVTSVIGQVPDMGGQLGARHMVAAAFGFELGEDGKSISRRSDETSRFKGSKQTADQLRT
jgi:hypothetical protein